MFLQVLARTVQDYRPVPFRERTPSVHGGTVPFSEHQGDGDGD